MPARHARRRSPGEGGVYPYKTGAGERHFYKCAITRPDGTRKTIVKRGFETKKAAQDAMREALTASRKGGYAEPSKQLTGDYLNGWLNGLRLAPSTVASYRKNVRVHIEPRIGTVPLASLTAVRLDALYRDLERTGRADHRSGEALSARTVRYIHTILSGALKAAVEAGLLQHNPAAKAHPPTAKQAQAPEQHPWNAAQVRAFLDWAREHSDLYPAWYTLVNTAMRRGELLALRWRDVDLNAGTITVRRSAGTIRVRGQRTRIEEGKTKTNKPRVIDIDPDDAEVLKSWKRQRGTLALALARDDALIFGDLEGSHLNPERFSRTWSKTVRRAIREGTDVPVIRLHDLRHTHLTGLLLAGVPVHVVSQRAGHASPTITMTIYAHVLPGSQREAQSRFKAWWKEAASDV
jgi:integrase